MSIRSLSMTQAFPRGRDARVAGWPRRVLAIGALGAAAACSSGSGSGSRAIADAGSEPIFDAGTRPPDDDAGASVGACGTAWYGERYADPAARLELSDLDMMPDLGWVIVGSTPVTSDGQPASGGLDALVVVVGPDGESRWTDSIGSTAADFATDVAVAPGGHVIVVGAAGAELPGDTSRGAADGFVRSYSQDGVIEWSTQFGSGDFDYAFAVAVAPDGSVVVAGRTGPEDSNVTGDADVFVARFDDQGEQIAFWTFGSSVWDQANGVAVAPSGEIYVTGTSLGTDVREKGSPLRTSGGSLAFPTDSYFLASFTQDGDQRWVVQAPGRRKADPSLGLPARADDAYGVGVVVDPSGDVWVAGMVAGDLDEVDNPSSSTESGLFVVRYAPSGDRLATTIPLPSVSTVMDLQLAGDGGLLVVGSTAGAFALGDLQTVSAGNYDAFAARLDPNGSPVAIQQIGSSGVDQGFAARRDEMGRVLVLGSATFAIDASARPPGATHFVKRFCGEL